MFTGLCAFPLTPLHQQNIDEKAFIRILARLTDAGVDSLGILGSTGSYAYLSREQRKRVVQVAKSHAGSTPMMVGVGAIATSEVLRLVEDAQQAGADALLLPMMSYQPLFAEEIYAFYEEVCRHASVPVCLYDNPRTTHVMLSDELQGRIAALPAIASIKIPGLPAPQASERVAALRRHLPCGVTLGVSGDVRATAGLQAGCEVWYSVCGGLFPRISLALVKAICHGDAEQVAALNKQLAPLWRCFDRYGGSLRVIAAAAAILGLCDPDSLPRPLLPLGAEACRDVAAALQGLA
ncbi:TPA: dihydrodipicolinate synthase family protein [Klebsiella quasipneumoniae subsp. similipneumoniae]|nr:dihydrodipicolinate synthase family protein [Klebsiella quasipneumoniae subsp. similipneumoniae]